MFLSVLAFRECKLGLRALLLVCAGLGCLHFTSAPKSLQGSLQQLMARMCICLRRLLLYVHCSQIAVFIIKPVLRNMACKLTSGMCSADLWAHLQDCDSVSD